MTLPYIYTTDGAPGIYDLAIDEMETAFPSEPIGTWFSQGYDATQIFGAGGLLETWKTANKDKLNVTVIGASSAVSYKYGVVLQSQDINTATLVTVSSNSFQISGLIPGSRYKIIVRAFRGAGGTAEYGNAIIKENILIPNAVYGITVGQTEDSKNESGKVTFDYNLSPDINEFIKSTPLGTVTFNNSLASITNTSQSISDYVVAYKPFPNINTTSSYYAFGTTMFLEPTVQNTNQKGGFGFFVSNQGNTGYFIEISTTASATSLTSGKQVFIYKIVNKNKVLLSDSQKINEPTTIAEIYGGQAYRIDVKVKLEASLNTITVFINGFKITATDNIVSSQIFTYPLASSTMAIYASKGRVTFDYIYGMSLLKEEYDQDSMFNVYSGKYSQNIIKFLFADKMFNTGEKENIINGNLEEFGTLAREIKYYNFRFENPSFPLFPTSGFNKSVTPLGFRKTPFNAELYVLNNSGTYTPLSDGSNSQLVVYGFGISKSGQLSYEDSVQNIYSVEEPVTFETNWLQNERDVINLSTWLKTQWAKKQTVVDMEIFGNPLLSVGDVIKIDYSYHGLTTSQKFLITNVNHSYQGGLSTSISCRTL